ncbi:Mannan endo-1 [Chlorella vulgaris]
MWLQSNHARNGALCACSGLLAFTSWRASECRQAPAGTDGTDASAAAAAAASRLHVWLSDSGADLDAVVFKQSTIDTEGRYGVYASEGIHQLAARSWWGKLAGWARRTPVTVATFPASAAVTAANLSCEPQQGPLLRQLIADEVADERTAVALWLAVERQRLGHSSAAAGSRQPWLELLPSSFSTTLFFSELDMQWLKGTTLFTATRLRQKKLRSTWERLEPAAQQLALLAGLEPPSLPDFLWANAVWWSRAVALPSLHEAGTEAATKAAAGVEAIVPGLDMCNHKAASPCQWTLSAWASHAPAVSLVCPRWGVPAPGQEVTIDYGDKSNEQLLFLYGFAELDNPAEVLTLIFPLPPPGEWDETLAARVELLQRRGLRPQLHLSAADLAASCATGSTKDGNASSPLPEGVMETLEVFVLSPQQLQQELQGASPGVADGASSSSSSSEGLGSSSGRVPGMAVLTTLLRLLELKVAEMEGVEDGTGPLEQDEELLKAASLLSRNQRHALIYRIGQKRLARAFLLDCRARLQQEMQRLRQRLAMRVRAWSPAVIIFVLLLAWSGVAQQGGGIAVTQAGEGPAGAAGNNQLDHFVKVEGSSFVVDCRRFFVSGWNMWELVEAAAGGLELFGASLPPNTTGPALVRRLLDRAVANKFNTAPGQYNEAVFRGLDYALDEARKRGIRLLLSLTDNWQQTGGADEFVRWAGSGDHESFFTDARAKSLYKGHVATVLQRVNTINGRRYSEDPTIFGWNLINEPRCYRCGSELSSWVEEMAAHVKALDPNHLLTVGEEGFYPAGLPQTAANPQGASSWANTEGQSFVVDHSSPNIDFLSIHLWINNWEDRSEAFARRWIQQHIADAEALGKPLLMEEFGVWGGDSSEQQLYYRLVYDTIAENARAGGPCAGSLFWVWYAEGQKAPAEEGGLASGLFGVFESNTATWSLIAGFASTMNDLSGGAAVACTADSPVAAVPPACSSKEGIGYEGPACNIDINECARQTAGCHPDAACTNTPGSFACRCFDGYEGDGASCSPTAALPAVQAEYVTDGKAQLACSEGSNLVYPEGTPGYQYDPTGALERVKEGGQQGGFGSRTDVEPVSCMLACNAAPGCNSFAYNPTASKCFLKAGGGRETCRSAPTVCVSRRGTTYSCGSWQTYFREGRFVAANGESAQPTGTNAQPTEDVLSSCRSKQQLASALKEVADKGEKLELDAVGLQGLVKELLQRALLESRYATALGRLVEQAAEVATSQAPPPGLEHALALIFNVVSELGGFSAGRPPGGGRAQRGRDLHGTALVPRLVAFLVAPTEPGAWSIMRQKASAALVEYLTNSRGNCELLAAMDSCVLLFSDVLNNCGDIDVLEALYRLARQGILRQQHRALFAPDFLAALDALLQREPRGLDLSSELRKLLVLHNRQLGTQASVYSVQAKSLQVSGIDGLAAPGMWVDFGLRSLAVGLVVPEDEDQDSQPDPELMNFLYADMLRMHTTNGSSAGLDRVVMSFKAMPAVLQEHSQSFRGQGNLDMQLKRSALASLPTYAPRVAQAMKDTGVAFAADGTLSSLGGQDMSQRGRKCSTGFTVYANPEAAAAGAPPAAAASAGAAAMVVSGRSSGRAPLQLTRSGSDRQRSEHRQQPTTRPRSNLGRGTSPALTLQRRPPPAPAAPPADAPHAVQGLEEVQPAQAGAGEERQAEEQQPDEQAEDRQAEERAEERQRSPAPRRSGAEGAAAPAAAAADTVTTGTATAAGAAPPVVAGSQRRGPRGSQQPVVAPVAAQPSPAAAQAAEVGEVNSPEMRPADGAKAGRQQQGTQRATAAAAARQTSQKPPGPADSGVAATAAGAAAEAEPEHATESEQEAGEEGEEEPDRQRKPARGTAAARKQQQAPAARKQGPVASEGRSQQGGSKGKNPASKAGGKAGTAKGKAGKAGNGKAAGGKAGGNLAGKAGRGKAGGKPAGGGKGASPVDDGIEETGPSAEGRDAHKSSPAPSWVKDQAAAAGVASHESSSSDSESELRHDHVSVEPLHKAAEAAKARGKGAGAGKQAAVAEEEQSEEEEEGHNGKELRPVTKKKLKSKTGSAAAKSVPSAGKAAGSRPCRAAAVVAAAKLAASPDIVRRPNKKLQQQQQQEKEERQRERQRPGVAKVFEFQAPVGERRQGGGSGKLAGSKRGRAAAQAPQGSEEPPTSAAIEGAMLDAESSQERGREESLPLAQEQPRLRRPAPPSPQVSSELVGGAEREQELVLEDSEAEEEDEEEELAGEEEGAEEEGAAAEGVYRSQGTGHLQGWTNFQAAEADVPNMLVAEDELRVITKRFKFTALKEKAPDAAGGASTGRRKAELKAAAAGVVGKKGAKPAAQSARLTTTLSQDGLAPVSAAAAAAGGCTGQTRRQPAQQQQQQRKQHGEPEKKGKAGTAGKRALEALGTASGQKRRKTGGSAAAAKPARAAGGHGGRKGPAPAAVSGSAVDDSQAPSIHRLLHSVQHRHAADSPHPSEDSDEEDEGDDMAALQAFMVEVAALVAELEGEVAAKLAAQQKEMQQAQQRLDTAVGKKFEALEEALEGKMREIDGATLAFQQHLNALWEEYRGLHDQVATAATEVEAAAGKQRAAAATSLESTRAALVARAADVARKIERGSKKASKMPELAQMLMPFLD